MNAYTDHAGRVPLRDEHRATRRIILPDSEMENAGCAAAAVILLHVAIVGLFYFIRWIA